jgi:hypothetical protein
MKSNRGRVSRARQIKGPRCVFAIASLLVFSSQLGAAGRPAQRALPELGVRNAHAMAYEGSRGRVILFGGADASKVCGDTWEWDGSRWARVSQTGPGPRTFPAVAYDSLRKRVVLFGGNRVLFGTRQDEDTFLGDTWEWDGRRWDQIKVSGPSPRAEAAMAFDSGRGRVVLFGGYNRHTGEINRLGDTWEWDGARWVQLKIAGPAPRNGAAQVYDVARKKIVLFGGRTPEGVSGETWEWDGRRWVENRAALTQGRFNCVLAYDGARRRVIRYGGRYEGKPVGDTWGYDGKAWKQLSSNGPTARNHTAMVYHSRRRKIVLFGGHDFGRHDEVNIFGDTWEWDGKEWSQKGFGEAQNRIDNGH